MTDTSDTAAPRGQFITFEGGEGTGKSTQIGHLAARLRTAGLTVTLTREPGGSAFAERLRTVILDETVAPKSPLAQALLFYSARADHLDVTIRPALTANQWVLCDRFADSTRVYQGAAGGIDSGIDSGVDLAALSTLDTLVVGRTQPALTILLDLDPKVGLARADRRRQTAATPGAFVRADTFEGRQLEFHQRLRDGFLALAKSEPARIAVFDAFQNELNLADQIWRHVAERFRLAVS
jgi:dTMP kinase